MKLLKYFLVVMITAVLCVFGMPGNSYASTIPTTRAETDILENTYYKIRLSIYESMPRNEGGIVFLGDSLTDYVPFNELLPDVKAINRGIAGDNTLGVLNRIDEVISLKPKKLFILLGTNDIVYNVSAERTVENLRAIILKVREALPETKIYLETLIPTNPNFDTHRANETINALNVKIKTLAEETDCELLDTHSNMAEDGILPLKYTIDGIHFNGAGVIRLVKFLEPFVRQ